MNAPMALPKPCETSLRIGLMLTAFVGLTACGFTPLYATPGVNPKLAAIQVTRPDGRAGFILGQSLDTELGRDAALAPVYRLNVALSEVRVPRGITVNNAATRYEVDLQANYVLSDIRTRKVVTKGSVTVNATYNASAQPYSSLADAQDGERRAASAAAERIRLELATFFASPRPDAPTVAAQTVGGPEGIYADTGLAQAVLSPRARAAGPAAAHEDTGAPEAQTP